MTKRTFQPKKKRRQRKHGFLSRMGTKNRQKVIKSRRRRGRKQLAT